MSKAYWIVRVSVRDEQRYPDPGRAAARLGAKWDQANARDRKWWRVKDRATAMAAGIPEREGYPSEIYGTDCILNLQRP